MDGVSLAEFSRFTGISEAALLRPQGRLTRAIHQRVILLSREFPPICAASMADRLASYPELGALWCNSQSMRSALLSYLHYRDVLGEFDTVHCRENDEGLLFEYRPDDQETIGEANALANFELLVGIAEHYAGEHKMLLNVELAGAISARWRTLADAWPVALHA